MFLQQDREERELFAIDETVEMADITIDNDSSLEDFYREIEERLVEPVLGDEPSS